MEDKNRNKEQGGQTENGDKQGGINPAITTITLNVSDLNATIKRYQWPAGRLSQGNQE